MHEKITPLIGRNVRFGIRSYLRGPPRVEGGEKQSGQQKKKAQQKEERSMSGGEGGREEEEESEVQGHHGDPGSAEAPANDAVGARHRDAHEADERDGQREGGSVPNAPGHI